MAAIPRGQGRICKTCSHLTGQGNVAILDRVASICDGAAALIARSVSPDLTFMAI